MAIVLEHPVLTSGQRSAQAKTRPGFGSRGKAVRSEFVRATGNEGEADLVLLPSARGSVVLAPEPERREGRPVRPGRGSRRTRVRQGVAGSGAHPLSATVRRQSEQASPPLRLTTRGKVIVGALTATVLAFSLWVAVSAFVGGEPGSTVTETVAVEVSAGDTAWDLASRLRPAVDPRMTVAQIEQINGLDSAGELRPGAVVQVPVGS